MFASRDGSSARTLARRTGEGHETNHASFHPHTHATPRGLSADHLSMPPATNRSVAPSNGRCSSESPEHHPSIATYPHGKRIFGIGQGQGLVYIVRGGCVRLDKTLSDGRSITVGLLGPNTIFTQESDWDGLATGISASALVDTTLSIVPSDDLAQVITETPELAAAVVTATTRRLTELQTLVEQLLARDTSIRLASTLLLLARSVGRPHGDGSVSLSLPLTHQALAGMIGSNRVTVTRKLSELQALGAVETLARNRLLIHPELLRSKVKSVGDSGTA